MATLVAVALALPASTTWAANPCVTAVDKGQDLQKAGKLREARAHYIACSQRTCNAVVRGDCETLLREVDEQTPSVVVRAVDSRGKDVLGARVTIDDNPIDLDGTPVQVDPGQRVIKARAKSGDVAEQKTLVALGEKARVIEVRFKVPLEQDGTKRNEPAGTTRAATASSTTTAPTETPTSTEHPTLLPRVLAGVGVVALGVFAGFEIAGHSSYSDLENGCFKTAARCTEDDIAPVRQQFVIAGVSLGVSLAAFTAALVAYLVQRPSQKASLVEPRALARSASLLTF
jgi:hypothetical protein